MPVSLNQDGLKPQEARYQPKKGDRVIISWTGALRENRWMQGKIGTVVKVTRSVVDFVDVKLDNGEILEVVDSWVSKVK